MIRSLNIFFFQAEDGIRDDRVTGVQTCALPIFVIRFCRRSYKRLFDVPAQGRDQILLRAFVFRAAAFIHQNDKGFMIFEQLEQISFRDRFISFGRKTATRFFFPRDTLKEIGRAHV